MTETAIRILLDAETHLYQPGDEITGRFQLADAHAPNVRAAELSVLWHTTGKGEEDLAVHFFERHSSDVGGRLDLRVPRRFAAQLPYSPLSYDGVIVKVCWCVRLRLFLQRGQELVSEVPFRLGDAGVDVHAS